MQNICGIRLKDPLTSCSSIEQDLEWICVWRDSGFQSLPFKMALKALMVLLNQLARLLMEKSFLSEWSNNRWRKIETRLAWLSLGIFPLMTVAAELDLTQFDIEALMQLKVVSAAKTEQSLQETAAAVFVVTAEDIRRSGATNVPEALRLVPGVEVARVDSSHWAVTIRGFNGLLANKLLVLIDGRSIYNNEFSGVYWENENLFMSDIERIEVIRGPGGTLWGANAVNGVINIITKEASDTQGGLVSLTAGNEEQAVASARYGGKLGDNADFRVFGQFRRRDEQVSNVDGRNADDGWRIGGGGGRIDWTPSAEDTAIVEGSWFQGRYKQHFLHSTPFPPYIEQRLSNGEAAGGSARFRWERQHADSSRSSIQGSYHYLSRESALYKVDSDAFALDFQNEFTWNAQQQWVWGLGYRRNSDQFIPTEVSNFIPPSSTSHWFSAFVQDQIELVPAQLRLTAGIKIEHNDYTGWEWQPSVRMLWSPHARHRVWGAVSRAVRTPARGEEDVRLNLSAFPPLVVTGNLPGLITVIGSDRLKSEELIAYEVGYRALLTDRLSLDTAVFYNDYDRLVILEPGTPFSVMGDSTPYLVVPLDVRSEGQGFNTGFEVAADWRPIERWRLQLAYSHAYSNMRQGVNTIYQLGKRNQFTLSSAWSLRDNLELDVWWRYVNGFDVAAFPTLDMVKVAPQHSLNFRVGWRPRKDVELSLVGTDVLDNQHLEFIQEGLAAFPTAIERSFYGQIKWSF